MLHIQPSLWQLMLVAATLIAAAQVAYLVVTLVCLRRLQARREAPARARPGLTVLKPLCGSEPDLETALRSFCEQSYEGPLQIIFGVHSYDDPALSIAMRLSHAFPDRRIEIVVDSTVHGPNRKVCNLANMSRLIQYDIVVVSDSDTFAEPDCLERVAAAFADPEVGAATCLYRGRPADQGSLVAQLGALYIDAFFLPAALTDATLFSPSVCYGPVMAIRRPILEAAGGFRALAHVLADDAGVGHMATRAGYRVALVPVAVDTVVPERKLADLLRHELRWARATRALRPVSYVASVLTHALPLTFLLVLFSPGMVSGLLFGMSMALRAILLSNVRTCFGRATGTVPPSAWMLFAREFLCFGVWLAGLFGRSIVWRGRHLQLLSNACIEGADSVASMVAPALAKARTS